MQHIYQTPLKEGNGYHKYLQCPDIQDNNFEIMCSTISLNKVDLACSKTVKAKPTGNYSGFITYSNTVYVAGIWLDNCGYLITQWQKLRKTAFLLVQELVRTTIFLKVEKISAKNDILTVQ